MTYWNGFGGGGMGMVYRAVHSKLGKPVAVKILPVERMQRPDAVARFEREMKAIGKLEHPNVVRAFDGGETADGRLRFLVMELVEGVDLEKVMQRMGPLDILNACEIVKQAASGLAYVHRQGHVHRDVKPSNLMLTSTGRVKILDLGLALLGGAMSDTLTGCGRVDRHTGLHGP